MQIWLKSLAGNWQSDILSTWQVQKSKLIERSNNHPSLQLDSWRRTELNLVEGMQKNRRKLRSVNSTPFQKCRQDSGVRKERKRLHTCFRVQIRSIQEWATVLRDLLRVIRIHIRMRVTLLRDILRVIRIYSKDAQLYWVTSYEF